MKMQKNFTHQQHLKEKISSTHAKARDIGRVGQSEAVRKAEITHY